MRSSGSPATCEQRTLSGISAGHFRAHATKGRTGSPWLHALIAAGACKPSSSDAVTGGFISRIHGRFSPAPMHSLSPGHYQAHGGPRCARRWNTLAVQRRFKPRCCSSCCCPPPPHARGWPEDLRAIDAPSINAIDFVQLAGPAQIRAICTSPSRQCHEITFSPARAWARGVGSPAAWSFTPF